jgi:hypothetical protein
MELLQQLIEFTASGQTLYTAPKPTSQNLKEDKPKLTTNRYEDDITSLSVFYSLEPGAEITIKLRDLLCICPRKRQRVDAYRGLVTELSRRGIVLIIKSRKSK